MGRIAIPQSKQPENTRHRIDALLRSILLEPIRKITPEEFLYRGMRLEDLSKAARKAVEESRLVEREFFGMKRVGYIHLNPDRSERVGHVDLNPNERAGGFVELTASVDDTAYIGKKAAVLDNASVTNYAAVFDEAIVYGYAWIAQYAKVFDKARVFDRAKVYNGAWIFGEAEVLDSSKVMGNARVSGKTRIMGKSTIRAGEFDKDELIVNVYVYAERRDYWWADD